MKTFWEFVNERHSIYLRRKAGAKPPWTDDPILQRYYFCNIFRELDKTTVWFRENVREPMKDDPRVIMATIIFRWFNQRFTGHLLLGCNLFRNWDSNLAKTLLREVHPVVTGAYIIKTPDGMNKLDGVCWSIDQMWAKRESIQMTLGMTSSLQAAWHVLKAYPYQGPFMSYEVVTDLRHTPLLDKASDIMTWCNIGPGAARGLEYMGLVPNLINVRRLLVESRSDDWKHPIKMEMRDIEHSLCEYAKYVNAVNGKKLKRLYHGTQS